MKDFEKQYDETADRLVELHGAQEFCDLLGMDDRFRRLFRLILKNAYGQGYLDAKKDAVGKAEEVLKLLGDVRLSLDKL